VTVRPDRARLSAFLAASLALAVAPGPAGPASSRPPSREACASVAGVVLGNLGSAWAASVGIAAIVAVRPGALAITALAGGPKG
jgi:hypothetical protein